MIDGDSNTNSRPTSNTNYTQHESPFATPKSIITQKQQTQHDSICAVPVGCLSFVCDGGGGTHFGRCQKNGVLLYETGCLFE